jgi:hypothetical protein
MSAWVMLALWHGLKEAKLQSMTIRDLNDRQRARKGLLIKNTSPKVKQWISITMLKFWRDWDSPFVARGQRKGNLERGLCITTMHRRTQLTRFRFFLANHGILVAQQPPYSPDMAPCDFWLYPQLKMSLKEKRFNDIYTIKTNTTKHQSSILKDSFKKYFQNWQNSYHKRIASELLNIKQ